MKRIETGEEEGRGEEEGILREEKCTRTGRVPLNPNRGAPGQSLPEAKREGPATDGVKAA
jgi:hypothetical protein